MESSRHYLYLFSFYLPWRTKYKRKPLDRCVGALDERMLVDSPHSYVWLIVLNESQWLLVLNHQTLNACSISFKLLKYFSGCRISSFLLPFLHFSHHSHSLTQNLCFVSFRERLSVMCSSEPQTTEIHCLCLQSAGIKGIRHHTGLTQNPFTLNCPEAHRSKEKKMTVMETSLPKTSVYQSKAFPAPP